MKKNLADKLKKNKDIKEASQLLTERLNALKNTDKNEIYSKVTALAQKLSVELTSDIVAQMGDQSDYATLAKTLTERAINDGGNADLVS